jgi:hypothetical protein
LSDVADMISSPPGRATCNHRFCRRFGVVVDGRRQRSRYLTSRRRELPVRRCEALLAIAECGVAGACGALASKACPKASVAAFCGRDCAIPVWESS